MMNKSLLFILFITLASYSNLFAQTHPWGDWYTAECFSGIQFRLRMSDEKSGSNGYKIFIQFKNNYKNKIAFSFRMKNSSPQESGEFNKHNGELLRTVIASESSSENDGISDFVPVYYPVFVPIGYFRIIDDGENEDLTKPYEVCDTIPSKTLVCLFCEHNPQPSCQNQVMLKNIKLNRVAASAAPPDRLITADQIAGTLSDNDFVAIGKLKSLFDRLGYVFKSQKESKDETDVYYNLNFDGLEIVLNSKIKNNAYHFDGMSIFPSSVDKLKKQISGPFNNCMVWDGNGLSIDRKPSDSDCKQ